MNTVFLSWLLCAVVCVEAGRRSLTTTRHQDGEPGEDATCLLEHTPSLDNVYCKSTLQRFEAKLEKILEKIELKTDNFEAIKGCRRGWHGDEQHCYYFSKEKKSWRAARDWCQLEANADLVSITDDTEIGFLRDKMANVIPDEDGGTHLWTGLNDISREGRFVWSDSTLASANFWKKGSSDFKYILTKTSNVTVLEPIPDMYAFTVCFWMKSEDSNSGTPVSYAAYTGSANELLVYDYSKLHLYVRDDGRTGNVSANDGRWHHICCTWSSDTGDWSLWKDGERADKGTGLQSGQFVRGGGILILGQEQDSVGGTFDQKQAFVGELSQFNLWDLVIDAEAIRSNMADCSGSGNVYSWYTNNVASEESHDIALLQEICEQPNNFEGKQDCVEIMDSYGHWNDADCERPQRFICKTTRVPRGCEDIQRQGHHQSGVYYIDPDDRGSFAVFCEMDIGGNAYTVVQRRFDMSVDFDRDWGEYKSGFGDLDAEFWLGNDKLNRLTGHRHHELRIDLTNAEGNTAYIVYDYFSVAHENDKYRLRLGHKREGDLPDQLSKHRHMKFTTKYEDNDEDNDDNCANLYPGGWWFSSCHYVVLNVKYEIHGGLHWENWAAPPITGSEMKIKLSDRDPSRR